MKKTFLKNRSKQSCGLYALVERNQFGMSIEREETNHHRKVFRIALKHIGEDLILVKIDDVQNDFEATLSQL